MPATYLAPGVYVEEVPSTQQPIAGVGTNTVGFIGVVPDEIRVPVANEDYDPTLAVAVAGGPDASQREIDRIGTEIQGLTDKQRESQRLLDAANDALSKSHLAPNERIRLEKERNWRTAEREGTKRDLEGLGIDRDELLHS